MKAWQLMQPGSLDGLLLRDYRAPDPGFKQLRVRIKAVALNNRDWMVIADQYGFPMRKGLIPLSDAAGEVIAVGDGVSRFKIGDRVSPTFITQWIGGPLQPEYMGSDLGASIDGVFAQELNFDESALVHLAPHLSDEQAATLCCAGITAWNSVKGLQAGDSVLVQGTGGVAVFAMQFAKLAGARVIATTSSEDKAEKLRALGISEIINYQQQPEWAREALRLTSGRGVDRVVEIGGPNTFEQSLHAVRIGGQISAVGFSGGFGATINPVALIGRGLQLISQTVGSRSDYEEMMRAIAIHQLQPVIDSVFDFEQAHEAFTHLGGKQHFGKIVVRCQ